MDGRVNIGFELRKLNLLFKKRANFIASSNGGNGLTGMHLMLLRYLMEHPNVEIYQKDIANLFSIRNSTVTSMIQLMEKRGLIYRESVGKDARLKKIMLTQVGYQICEKTKQDLVDLNEKLINCLTDDELVFLLEITKRFSKILTNYGGEND